jgi:hypothetical protein
MSKKVSFKNNNELNNIHIFENDKPIYTNTNTNTNKNQQKFEAMINEGNNTGNDNVNDTVNDTDNDTDYEEDKLDPKEVLINLLKGRSFGTDSYGDDYESSVELKRNLETTFENLHKLAFNIDNLNKFNQFPNINNNDISKARLCDLENNNIDKILGSEKDKEGSPCPKCYEPIKMNYNPCAICSRETIDVRCINCVPNILELCSPKCRSIYEGEMSVIEITNNNDETMIIIEDDGENMVLQVVNHNLFYQELNQKDSLTINKPCINCLEDLENDENSKWEEYKEALNNNEPVDNLMDPRTKIGVIPVKCYNCNENYSYLIVCPVCYQKSGIKFICDEC